MNVSDFEALPTAELQLVEGGTNWSSVMKTLSRFGKAFGVVGVLISGYDAVKDFRNGWNSVECGC